MTVSSVLIFGAGGAVGLEAARNAAARGLSVVAAYRTERSGVSEKIQNCGARAVKADLEDTDHIKTLLAQSDAVIFTPILSVSAQAAPLLGRTQRAIFFSSNNVAIDPQADDYARILEAEAMVQRAAPAAAILRPTMIYGYPGDGNISRLMTLMRRAPLVPMIGRASALQQPVYFKDLARAALDELFNDAKPAGVCAVAGPTAITKKELYQAVAAASGARTHILPAPVGPAAAMAQFLERAGQKTGLKRAQLQRADLDKTPRGGRLILGETRLEDGLRALAAEL
ncbi:NmrA family NAD(P)-binding protein [Hyphococcus sp.]|uniref:NmrA family NAD(P)-binding protein n=1 Tax=Hyphococcus sp. TaxID=2038636 RepID=UPI003CCB743A